MKEPMRSPVRRKSRWLFNAAVIVTDEWNISTGLKRGTVTTVHSDTSAAQRDRQGWSYEKRIPRRSKCFGPKCRPKKRNGSIVVERKWLKHRTLGSKPHLDYGSFDCAVFARQGWKRFGCA